jgi:PAS domain S-box-containing protein
MIHGKVIIVACRKQCGFKKRTPHRNRVTANQNQMISDQMTAESTTVKQIANLFQSSPMGVALTTFDGKFLAANAALLGMLRATEAELLEGSVNDVYADPDQRELMLNQLRETGSLQDYNLHLLRLDGSTFFARINSSPVFLEGEEVIMALVDDISEKIAAEQEAAAQEERERLAHELHDSVSQILFAAGMIADAAPSLWDKDPALGQQNLEMLSKMIRGASAEMRSLLLELRPDTLRDQTLGRLLETLTIAARARSQAGVSLNVEGDCPSPDDVTLALHRIAQESLNNVAKHAQAGEIQIDLRCSHQSVELRIKDDGRGFDPQAIPAGHLGIGIMHERADKIGAILQINSKPGEGTSVDVSWTEGGSE